MPANTQKQFDHSPECEATQSAFLHRQLFVTPPLLDPSVFNLRGKTAIVTGSNGGLGLECSRQLLDLGLSRLILAVRDERKGQAAREDLAAGRKACDIQVWKIDLSSYDSIIAFVERCKTLPTLDMAVLNAGLFKSQFELNPVTRHDEVVQVNYLSTALLTILLLPVVQAKAQQSPGRIVIVNSDASAQAKFKERKQPRLFHAFDDPKNFDAIERYITSKLLGQLFLVELAKRVPPTVAIVNAVSPGLCRGSSLHREMNSGMLGAMFSGYKRVLGRPTDVGARTLTDAAVNHGKETHGQYLSECKIKPMAPMVYTPDGEKAAAALWRETMAELSFASAAQIIAGLSWEL
ncbi:hypothetical protein C8Q76DRAFT_615793 [Earliella scabrosa]|nr:hypothetical protein C8Q76DRAFT_615793 [Earliella scabrosa]